MKRVRLTQGEDGKPAGSEIEVDDDQAEAMVANGTGEIVGDVKGASDEPQPQPTTEPPRASSSNEKRPNPGAGSGKSKK